MARIYIETTVVSFYFNARPEPEMVARQNWTRRWLDAALLGSDELVSSVAVETELNVGDFPTQIGHDQAGITFSIAGHQRCRH